MLLSTRLRVNNAPFLRHRKTRSHPRIRDNDSIWENKVERAGYATAPLHVGPTRAESRPKVDQRIVVDYIAAAVLFVVVFNASVIVLYVPSGIFERVFCRLNTNLVLRKES